MNHNTSILSQEQIDSLYKFCQQHYVREYDVQTELVDHLATAIEEKMVANKHTSFEKALEEVYSSFGVMGFAPVVSSRMDQLHRTQVKMKWQLFKQLLTPPMLFATLLLPVCIITLSQLIPHFLKGWGTYILLGIGMFLQIFTWYRVYKLSKKQRKKLLLTHNVFTGVSSGNSILIFLNMLHWKNQFDAYYDLWSYMYICFYSLAILMVLIHYQFVRSVYASARTQYPAAFA